MRIVAAQINPVVGDIAGNVNLIRGVLEEWKGGTVDLFVFPELCITGYPPRDLLERSWLTRNAASALDDLLAVSRSIDAGILVGLPVATGLAAGKGLYNAAILIHQGRKLLEQHKTLLPTYDVFDEDRYFDPGRGHRTVEFKGETLGITICEDAWNDPSLWHRPVYSEDPVEQLAQNHATLLINISASPYYIGKESIRRRLICNHTRRHGLPFVFVNQVGGNDELIFDGRSICSDASGELAVEMDAFRSETRCIDTGTLGQTATIPKTETVQDDPVENLFRALTLGLHDYIRKCGFSRVLIGLSGGIDSAMVSALAVEALGAGNVTGVTMPGPFSSRGSVDDSLALARNLGIDCHVIPINRLYESFLEALEPQFRGTPFGTAEENIQARIRGNLLMALSNKSGALVLTTGNKSEMAVGYCTLYGDMSGGLSVLSDVPKTWVYRLAEHINRSAEVIPPAIIDKAPSAELRANQTDQDTLPPYPVLDGILEAYVDDGLSFADIVRKGYDDAIVRWVMRAVDRNEYKRRQAAPGLKVTSKSFGVGRRMPVAARYEV